MDLNDYLDQKTRGETPEAILSDVVKTALEEAGGDAVMEEELLDDISPEELLGELGERAVEPTEGGEAAEPKTADEGADEVLHRADMALYKAKEAGRNQVGVSKV